MNPDPEIVTVSPPISERYEELNDRITGCSNADTEYCGVLRPICADIDVTPWDTFTVVVQMDFTPDKHEQLGNNMGESALGKKLEINTS